MKMSRAIVGVALLFCGCTQNDETENFQSLETGAPVSAQMDSDLKREIDFAYGVMPTNNPLSPEHLPTLSTHTMIYLHHSFSDYLFSIINPEAFQKYEGSYTIGEFKAQQEDQVPEYNLSSSWFIHNRQLPKTGITVARNPATGKYEVSGGEIFFQQKGVGVSYEKDEVSGETQTFLNFKRDF